MAVDKLVDSAKLDACLDAEADAIRAKTGGSADIPFDFANNKGFADAIAAIPTGGSGDKTLTMLGEYVVEEPVHTISISLTDSMRSSIPLYVEFDNLAKDAADYTYIGFGRFASMRDFATYFPNRTTDDGVAAVINTYKRTELPSGKSVGRIFGVGGIINGTISVVFAILDNEENYLIIQCDASNKNFTAGTIRVYGEI